jgi:hypothetical protein
VRWTVLSQNSVQWRLFMKTNHFRVSQTARYFCTVQLLSPLQGLLCTVSEVSICWLLSFSKHMSALDELQTRKYWSIFGFVPWRFWSGYSVAHVWFVVDTFSLDFLRRFPFSSLIAPSNLHVHVLLAVATATHLRQCCVRRESHPTIIIIRCTAHTSVLIQQSASKLVH